MADAAITDKLTTLSIAKDDDDTVLTINFIPLYS